MKILVTGATGFLGSRVVHLARERGFGLGALVRPGRDASALALNKVEIARGELSDSAAIERAVEGVGAVIHCAAATSQGRPNWERSRAINVEGTRRLLDAAKRSAGPGLRWIQISSMSAHAKSTSVYGVTKREADEAVRASGLAWTILRPSVICGASDRGVAAGIVRAMRRLPVVPIVGSGRETIRPVHVDDVAGVALDCIGNRNAISGTYMIGGPEELTMREFIERLGRANGLRRPLLPIPIGVAMLIARAAQAVTRNPPITADNVLGVKEAERVDNAAAERALNFRPRAFDSE